MSHLRKNPRLADKVWKLLAKIDKAMQAVKEGKESSATVSRLQAELIPLCGFNFGLLMPMYFIDFIDGQPLSFLTRPYMFVMTCLPSNSVVTLMTGRQVGKCVDGETMLATDAGAMKMADLFAAGKPCRGDAA